MSNITTCLWFNKEAEEAANFYVKLFNDAGRKAKIGQIARYGQASAKVSGQPAGSVMTVVFNLDDTEFMALNGGTAFKFSPATSFVIDCNTQEEIDYFWSKLSEDGKEGQCGWIDSDKFGITWQVVPKILAEFMGGSDPLKTDNVMKAIISMKKIEIAALKKAYEKQ